MRHPRPRFLCTLKRLHAAHDSRVECRRLFRPILELFVLFQKQLELRRSTIAGGNPVELSILPLGNVFNDGAITVHKANVSRHGELVTGVLAPTKSTI